MEPARPFELVYDREVAQHVAAIDAKYRSLLRRTIEEQLAHQPGGETRNRKPLQRPSVFGTAWELRFGPDNRFRVFYRVDEAARQVLVLAIGEKRGTRLVIGGEEFEL
jgi:hypothetical protein